MFKKSFTIILISTLLTLSISATAENGALTKYKPFSEVIRESISTDIDNIGYGMILFSETYNPIAANLDDEDLQLVLDAYKEIDGERIEAPYNDTMFPSCYDEQNTDEYFFIGLSEKLPNERWTWNNTKMTALFFGGGQNGDVMYGSFGRKNSEYGEDYPKPVSSYFIWYRPHDEGQERITEIGKYIYDKYKPIAKPFGDYEGTQDDNLFNGYDGVWQTMFYLPDCLNTNGSSDWAEYTLQLAALEGLYT